MASRSRRLPPRSLRRKVGTRTPRKTILIFCEGERTEPLYLDALRREPAVRDVAAVDLQIEEHAGSAPLTLLRAAVAARKRATAEVGEIDDIWCVFDVEWPINHPGLKDALHLAEAHGIGVAISNPCFEVWLVLHFQDHNAWLDSHGARRLRRACDGRPDKSLDGATYMPHRADAARRARKLDERHAQDGTHFPNNNPSSGMHRLLVAIEPSAAESTAAVGR